MQFRIVLSGGCWHSLVHADNGLEQTMWVSVFKCMLNIRISCHIVIVLCFLMITD